MSKQGDPQNGCLPFGFPLNPNGNPPFVAKGVDCARKLGTHKMELPLGAASAAAKVDGGMSPGEVFFSFTYAHI